MVVKSNEMSDGNMKENGQPNDPRCTDQQGSGQGIIDILFVFTPLDEPEISRFKGKQDQGI